MSKEEMWEKLIEYQKIRREKYGFVEYNGKKYHQYDEDVEIYCPMQQLDNELIGNFIEFLYTGIVKED